MSSRVQKHGEIILQNTRSLISLRYHTVTKAINKEFWNSTSDTLHSIYVGSYGRNTAIDTSDIDILVELPSSLFDRYNNLSGNSQSRLLQAVRNAILNTYPRSDVRADGQVVKIAFQMECILKSFLLSKVGMEVISTQMLIQAEAGVLQIPKQSKKP